MFFISTRIMLINVRLSVTKKMAPGIHIYTISKEDMFYSSYDPASHDSSMQF